MSTTQIKHVVPHAQVAHLWAHQVQADAHTPGDSGRMYFEGDTIYSYGSHFPIARHVTNRKGEKAILFTTSTYSATTRGHCSCVAGAIPPGVPVFRFDFRGGVDGRDEYALRFNATLAEAAKSRKHTARLLTTARAIATEAAAYYAFNGWKFPASLFTEPTDLKAHFAEQTRKQRAAAKAAAAKQARLKAEAVQRAVDFLPSWRRGENPRTLLHSMETVPAPRMTDLPFAYFRQHPNAECTIETTLGAQFPAAHGKRAYRTLLPVRRAGGTYAANGHTIHVGAFQVDSMDAAGVIKAGCHTVEWSEVERLAGERGWTT